MISFTVITVFAVIFHILTIRVTFQVNYTLSPQCMNCLVVARERFELSSRAPEAPMLDHYTTGLYSTPSEHVFYVITLASCYSSRAILFLKGISDAVAAVIS
jgi:hypothetical protein